jgi:hypothetical protein
MPSTGTLSGLAARSASYTSPTTADYTLQNNGGTSNLTGQITTAVLNFVDTACSTNCAIVAGDLLKIQMVQAGGNSGTKDRRVALSVADSGAIFHAGGPNANTQARWSGGNRSFAQATPTPQLFCAPVAHSATARNLQVHVVGSISAALTGTLWNSTDNGSTIAAPTLTCATGTGSGATCGDTTHTVALAAGDCIALEWHLAGGTGVGVNPRLSVELVP